MYLAKEVDYFFLPQEAYHSLVAYLELKYNDVGYTLETPFRSRYGTEYNRMKVTPTTGCETLRNDA